MIMIVSSHVLEVASTGLLRIFLQLIGKFVDQACIILRDVRSPSQHK